MTHHFCFFLAIQLLCPWEGTERGLSVSPLCSWEGFSPLPCRTENMEKVQIWLILNLCMRICDWREQGNGVPESLSWKKNGIVAQEVGNEDRWEIGSMRDGDLKQGWSFACYGKIRPLCSQSVCRTWQSRVWHSLWRESGEESIRINGFISQSKSREGKMKITPLSALFCPIIQLSIRFSSSFRFVTYCL